jgi:ribosomal protein S9
MEVAQLSGKFDIYAMIDGGGLSRWADALAHGTSRALLKFDESLRANLRKAGLLTRDPRPASEGAQEGRPEARPQGTSVHQALTSTSPQPIIRRIAEVIHTPI